MTTESTQSPKQIQEACDAAIEAASAIAIKAEDYFIEDLVNSVFMMPHNKDLTEEESSQRLKTLTTGLNKYVEDMTPIADRYKAVMTNPVESERLLADAVIEKLHRAATSPFPSAQAKHFVDAAELYEKSAKQFEGDSIKLAVFKRLVHLHSPFVTKERYEESGWVEFIKNDDAIKKWENIKNDLPLFQNSELNDVIKAPFIEKYLPAKDIAPPTRLSASLTEARNLNRQRNEEQEI